MTRAVFDVAVIGGGLHGLSAALHLRRAGKRVILLERAWIGRHASGASAAGVRTLNRNFHELDLSLESMEMWRRIESIVGDHCGFHAHGQICVGEEEGGLAKLSQRVNKLRSMGYQHEDMIDANELRRLVPAISAHCIGASIARADGAADPHRTLAAFRRSAGAAGVEIREGLGVRAIEQSGQDWRLALETSATTNGQRRGGDAAPSESIVVPAVVNAAGAWAGHVAAMVGEEISLGTKASMMIATERIAPMIKPVVSAIGRVLSFKQSDQGTLVIGGGLQGVPDLNGENTEVRLGVLSRGVRAATDLFPSVGNVRIVRVWSGLEAKTDDLLPVIGASVSAPNFFHAFGFSGHGFQLVPVVGAAIADLIVKGSTSRPIASLSASRFNGSNARLETA